ncbi:hypothetical protein Tco_0678876 [Tanacetum coccineum]|uniref:Uncharacterized protein n=1 Tax=Tanacetum coccineum TaxID=301880 RepID=A0ABQ4XGW4_9ASTR
MTKVIKGEFEKLEDLKVKDVSLTYDTSLEVFNNEFNRLSGMDDDLFTYEVEVANILCDLNKDDDSEQRMSHEADDDMGYDPSDVAFTEWLRSKFLTTRRWIIIKRKHYGFTGLEEMMKFSLQMKSFLIMKMKLLKSLGSTLIYLILKHLCARPLMNLTIFCKSIQTYLLRTLRDSRLMKNIRMIGSMNETKIYHGLIRNHGLTLDWKNDGYCNGGNLPGAYIVGDSLHYQDYEWYEALKDSELKEQALRNKAIMEGLISDDESSNNAHELLVCNMRRFKMIKYSFGQDKEYVVIKEDEYDDLAKTNDDACRAYQEIFRMIDEGWMVTRAE